MNEELMRVFIENEVKQALFQICPTKAPGLNGFPTTFFQKHWNLVGEGVLGTCLHILNEKDNITPLNHIYIALILKVKKLRDVTNIDLLACVT